MGVLGIARDITARNQAEQDLRDSQKRYHSLFENMQEGFADTSLEFVAKPLSSIKLLKKVREMLDRKC